MGNEERRCRCRPLSLIHDAAAASEIGHCGERGRAKTHPGHPPLKPVRARLEALRRSHGAEAARANVRLFEAPVMTQPPPPPPASSRGDAGSVAPPENVLCEN